MTLTELLSELKRKNIRLYLDNGDLRGKFPPNTSTPELRSALQNHKAEIIEYLQQTQSGESYSLIPIKREGDLPLSFSQERLWFLDQFEPGSASYNLPGAVRLSGDLNIEVLRRCFDEIIRRHEVLRTTFVMEDSKAIQVIAPKLNLTIEMVDLSGLPEELRELEVRRYLAKDSQKPFVLARGPLVWASLFSLGLTKSSRMKEHVMLFTLHHIVSDGWSTAILIREFITLYEAFSKNQASPLPELPIQYADYAVWQRQWLQGERLEKQLNYWKQKLIGAPAVLKLPTDRPRPVVQNYRGAAYYVAVPKTITSQLKLLSRKHDVTLFMVLLAAFNVLLSRYSGQTDLCVGTPIANRSRLEIEGLIGFFVNTLVLRTDSSGNPPFTEFLKCVKETCLGAQAHQDLPFEKLVEELAPVRDMSHNPLFQVMLTLQNMPETAFDIAGLKIVPELMETETAKFDLDLEISEGRYGLEVQFIYNTDLFDQATIVRMAEHYRALLENITMTPNQLLSELKFLTEPEYTRLLVAWQGIAAEYPRDKCIHQLFEEQADINPSAVAVVFEGEQLTYEQLNRKANRLARYLRSQGVGAEVLVGICVERSLEMIVGILGILKAGGAYLPLDPELPPGRLRQILQDAGTRWVLTQSELAAQIPDFCSTVNLHLEIAGDDRLDGYSPVLALDGQQLAYMLYTSGTTGAPKGVGVNHSNLVNQYFAWEAAYALQSDYVHLQMARYTFDVFAGDWIRALCSGGKLVICPRETLLQPAHLYALMQREQATVAEFVPAVLRLLAEYLEESGQRLVFMKLLVCGSDRWYVEEYKKFLALCDQQTRLINSYGLTEVTIDSTYFETRQVKSLTQELVPIGQGFANTHSYILDRWLNPAPIGVAGELYIGGAGVVRGYFNRPELTAERFIPNPFSDKFGGRLYKTGDVVRYMPDGNIEHLGRTDHQVKVRGFRIELGEIEATLLQHPAISEAVVVARDEGTPDTQRLIAYVVGDPAVLGVDALRAHLKAYLPDYMMPAAFVILDSLPLNTNGKVDRKALTVPDIDSQFSRQYVAPRTPTEEAVASIWAEVLGLERVGMQDNFFELGGHSLLAMTLIERMRRQHLNAEVRSLFMTQTLAEFAAAIESHLLVEVPANRIPFQCESITPEMLPLVMLEQENINSIVKQTSGGAKNIQDIYPLTPFQEGILFHHLMSADGDPYLLSSLLAFDARAKLDAFLAALQAVIERHDILRTAVMWEGLPEPVQVVLRQVVLPVTEVEIDGALGDAAKQLQAKYDPRCFRIDVRQAPLLRGYIARDVTRKRWLLLILEHHLALDHVAMEVLLREVQAHLLGRFNQLAEPLPFRNFVAQTRIGKKLEEHEVFFREMLGDVTEPTAPFGLLDVQGDGSGLAEAMFDLDSELSQRIRLCARSAGVSAASLFHLAWARVLAQISGKETVVFGTVLFGRMQGGDEADRMLGMFINTLPVRFDVTGAGVNAGTQKMHRLLSELLRHEHAPLALAQRCSAIPAPTPLFSALLNYRHSSKGGGVIPDEGLSVWQDQGITILAEEERTNYPLSLSVDDFGDGFRLNMQSRIDPQRICAYLNTVLVGLVDALMTQPSTALCTINVLAEPERQQLLVEWNALAARILPGKCTHELFEEQAEKRSNAVAVFFEGEEISYGQLNRKANQLAHYLRSQGVGPEDLVGICVERSLEMIVGILGVLKSGGAYLPLDPNSPPERIAFMLMDAKPRMVLTQALLVESLPEGIKSFCLDRDFSILADHPVINPVMFNTPANTAYVIYTSGSTGKPKGVMVTHHNVHRLFAVTETAYGFNATDVWTLFHSYAFDFSVWEIWGALLYGGQLVVVPHAVSRSPESFHRLLVERGVTVLNQTPTSFYQLDHFDRHAARKESLKLRLVIFGGEALEFSQLRKWFERYGDAHPRLVNMYGITETTVHVTWSSLTQSDAENLSSSMVGHPLPDLQAFILDGRGNPAPIGVPGELYIGGSGLAHGYLNRADLTAERFVPHPFGNQQGERLYRTGDLARYREDGNIEYLGRIDHQVKIRGFRIELGEIEGVLAQHPLINEVVVMAREDVPGEKRLVAYVAIDNFEDVDVVTDDLRAYLQERLPDYMVPAAFVFLENLPLTINGKVDRKALPLPDIEAQMASQYVAPRNATEEILANIWAKVLRLQKIGIDDNFFALGGDSIRSIQVVGLAKEQGLTLPMEQLYRCGTIRLLAQTLLVAIDSAVVEIANLELFSLINIEDLSKLPAGVQDAYPLTEMQAGMIFHSEQEPGAYHVVDSIKVQCVLDAEVLRMALEQVFVRHPVLRTTFDLGGFSEPLQIVHQWCGDSLAVHDLRHLSPAEQEEVLAEYLQSVQSDYFDISELPLIRFSAHYLAADRFQLTVAAHHAIIDGWSLVSLLIEVLQRCLAMQQGQVFAEKPLPNAMLNLVVRERSALYSDTDRAFWKRWLSDATINSFPRLISDDGGFNAYKDHWPEVELRIPQALAGKLKQLAQSLAVSLKCVLLASHLRILSLLYGETNITTGLITSVRPEELDGDQALGVFLNTLPLCAQLNGGTWSELIVQAFAAEREMLNARYYPLASLQRLQSNAVLFDTTFNYLHYHIGESFINSESVKITEWNELGQSNFVLDVTFNLEIDTQEIKLTLQGDREWLDRENLGRIGEYFISALSAIAHDPSGRYDADFLLSAAERDQLLVAWQGIAAEYPRDKCIHQLFEEQADINPSAVAVVFEGEQLTYEQLNRKANRLARYLRSQGVGAEVLVGICVERSLEMIVGILGILKAGGAYLPLDPELPPGRLRQILQDAGTRWVLTQSELAAQIPDFCSTVNLHLEIAGDDRLDGYSPVLALDGQQLAYMLYTSGTTGAPKGVGVNHSNLVNQYFAWEAAYALQSDYVHLQMARYTFDVFAGDWIRALCSGGKLVICPRETLLQPAHLYALMQREQATVAEFVPAVLRLLAEYLEESGQRLVFMKLLVCGSDRWYVEEYKKFLALCDQQTRLINSYGLTEVTIDSTYFETRQVKSLTQELVPIGQGFANTHSYILDRWLNPAPIGVAGELYIGGAGVVRGYFNRPELTAERFIPNPFSDKFGGRLYKTGDVVRYMPDGNIEHLGRTDHQVKVRGFRIELGEIEATLLQHPAISEAVVVARDEGTPDTQRLIAYVVGDPAVLGVDALRAHLKAYLPDYMMPAAFVILDSLPLNTNGKVDRKALPAPDINSQFSRQYVAPRTPTEEAVALIWAEVLGLERVGMQDNFFELGGHSLLATQVIARVRRAFSIELPLSVLLRTPTIEGMSVAVEEAVVSSIELLTEAEAEYILETEHG